MRDFTTIEYIMPATAEQKQQANMKPTFIIMVDTAIDAKEMADLKDSLQQSINFIPPEAQVGLITYGKMAFVHELGFPDCPKASVFRGDKEMTPKDIQDQLGLNLGNDPLKRGDSAALKRFLVPASECEFTLNSILDDLQSDPWPVAAQHRAQRCMGTALNIAVSLLETCGKGQNGSRILNLLGGPVTFGPGKIVDEPYAMHIRSHLDMQKERDNCKFLKPAVKFYGDIADRAQKIGVVIDLFSANLDQFGCIEMKSCFELTGGSFVSCDSFGNPVFKESFKKFFDLDAKGDLKMGFLAQTKVLCSKEIKVSGAIG